MWCRLIGKYSSGAAQELTGGGGLALVIGIVPQAAVATSAAARTDIAPTFIHLLVIAVVPCGLKVEKRPGLATLINPGPQNSFNGNTRRSVTKLRQSYEFEPVDAGNKGHAPSIVKITRITLSRAG